MNGPTFALASRALTLGRGNRVAAIGDSITSQAGPETQRNAKGYINWMGLLSDQQARWDLQEATSGHKVADVLSTAVPAITARDTRPDYCIVLAGTNDLSAGTSLSNITSDLAEIYARLRAAGIVPVPATLPPNGTSSYHATIGKVNTWIARHAAEHGYPMLDFFGALVDPSTNKYDSSLSDDGVHPNEAGAEVLGQLAADELAPILTPWSAPLSTANDDPSNLNSNALFEDDGNADGVPDGWSVLTGAADATITLETPGGSEGVAGQWLKIERTGTSAQTILRAGGFAVGEGDTLSLGFKVKTSGLVANSGQVLVDVIKYGAAATRLAGPLYSWPTDIDEAHVWYGEFTVPSGTTNTQLQINFTSGKGTLYIAQMTYRNLSDLGIV